MQLRNSEVQLRALAGRLISIREEERARIAREIHDELGQVLTGLKMDVTWLAKRLAGAEEPLVEKADAMCRLIDLHRIGPIVDKVFPWTEAKAAFTAMQGGEHFGKIVLEF